MNSKPMVFLIGTLLLEFGEYVFLNNYSTHLYDLTTTGQAIRALDPEYNVWYQSIQTAVYGSIISFIIGLVTIVFGLKMKDTQERTRELA